MTPVVLGLGEVGELAVLRAHGVTVVTVASLEAAPTGADVVMVVTRGRVAEVRAAGPRWSTPPLLALVDDVADAPAAIADGADHVLPSSAPPALVHAAYLAACREVQLRRRARALEAALELVTDSVEVSDAESRLGYVNQAFETMMGYSRAEALGSTPNALLRSDVHDAEFYRGIWDSVVADQRWRGAIVGRRKDGERVASLAVVAPVFDAPGHLHHVVAVKQSALATGGLEATATRIDAGVAALRNSELRFRTMMSAAPDAILIADLESAKFLDSNAAATTMFGYSAAELRNLTGRTLAGPDAGESVDRASRALTDTGSAVEPRHPMRRKDGAIMWAHVSLTAFEFMGRPQYMAIIHDVTEQVAHEQELERAHRELELAHQRVLHTSRLAALGQLAASVAHEINNPLHYVLAGIEALDELVLPGHAEQRQTIEDMREGLERIRQVTRSLLPFARVDGARPAPVDLGEVIAWATRVTANEVRHRARLVVACPPVRTIVGHRTGLGQLVTNLLTNAAHAIVEGASERNTITVTLSEHADRLQIVVEDTGTGMSADVQARAFEPFFTTKPRELGTGLGLALCGEIVALHHGTIELASTLDVGTRVTVTLADPPAPRALPLEAVVPAARGARILVVDDEEILLRVYRRQLHDLEVVTVLGGQAAIDLLQRDTAFDAVICDIMMPNVDGLAVFTRIGEVVPSLQSRVIFCSGGVFTTRSRDFLRELRNVVLDKPITAAALRTALDHTLATPR